eukprot:6280315-Alexandrium_andersonii.AAC.1
MGPMSGRPSPALVPMDRSCPVDLTAASVPPGPRLWCMPARPGLVPGALPRLPTPPPCARAALPS